MFVVAVCRVCGFVTYARSVAALRRNMALHYASHVCKSLQMKYAVSRGTCVKLVLDKARVDRSYERYFDVMEVR
jgi:L-alanine-DL-glutamate epimerase-like enolase superfamily enzyme